MKAASEDYMQSAAHVPAQQARLWVLPTWHGEGGARQLYAVSLPLVLSALSAVINLFFDRYFLAKYDLEYHMTATLSSSMTWWTIQNFGLGLVSYVGIFVAQYYGANKYERIGSSIWQALYLAFAAGIANLALIPLYGPFFNWIHPENPKLAALEAMYCEVLSVGAILLIASTALSFFFTGRGKTRLVMMVSFISAGVNILMNWWWIFSPPPWLPFLEPGLNGAAWATNVSFLVGFLIYVVLAFSPVNEQRFGTRSGWRLEWPLLSRLVRYGFPQAMHHIIEVGAFTFFFLMVGRVDPHALTASNIAFTLNIVLFVPMLGIAQAVGILIGQFVGAGHPERAEQSTCMAMLSSFLMMLTAATCYIFFPEILIQLFVDSHSTPMTTEIARLARLFLLFVACYSIADVFGLTYSSAIKGAGDTKFVMLVALSCAFFTLALPCALAAKFQWPAWTLWMFAVLYIYLTAIIYVLRYRGGRWKSMRVIEPEIISDPQSHDVSSLRSAR